MMLNLITNQTEFETFCNSTDWSDAYIRSIHFASTSYQSNDGVTTVDRFGSLLIVIIAIAAETDKQVFELVAFETEFFWVFPNSNFDREKKAMIQRRVTEAELGGLQLRCGCIGYRRLPTDAANENLEFREESVYDGPDFAPPYNIDWRAALDLSCRNS
jgi:hypothetical protein